MKRKIAEKKLLAAFAILILLIVCTGVIGILQIRDLSQRIEQLGKRNLNLEKAILEMKINNAVYAMGIRNYVFWRVSRYLGAVPMAINPDSIFEAASRFKEQLKIYEENSYSGRQREWAGEIAASFKELTGLGRQIVDLIGTKQQDAQAEEKINELLMVFENRLYKIDKFLDNTMSKENLSEIEKQLIKTEADKTRAVLFLGLVLISATLTGTFIALSVYRQRNQERLLRQQLLNRMINLEENERKNLSCQIHDQMGQDLSALKIYLGIVEQALVSLSQEAKDKVSQCRKIVSGLIDKSHNIAFLLRPPALDEVGLVMSFEALLLDYRHLTGVNYVYQKPQEELRLPSEYNLLLYRIAQELLTNMTKHSQAKNIKISLDKKEGFLEFAYQDDGVGFQYSDLVNRPKRRWEDKLKLGLLGLKERVELLDGTMKVETAPERGTRVTVKLNV